MSVPYKLYICVWGCLYCRTPLTLILVICFANYPDSLALLINLSRVLQKFTCLEITGYLIKYGTVLLVLELQIRHGQKV
jgi:hypothetical protein